MSPRVVEKKAQRVMHFACVVLARASCGASAQSLACTRKREVIHSHTLSPDIVFPLSVPAVFFFANGHKTAFEVMAAESPVGHG